MGASARVALGALAALAQLLPVTARAMELSPAGAAQQASQSLDEIVREHGPAAYALMQLRFQPNHGQADSRVRFLAQGWGYSLLLGPGEVVLSVFPPGGRSGLAPALEPTKSWAGGPSQLRVKLLGASPRVQLEGMDRLPIPASGAGPSYAKLRYRGIYPGVDLVLYGYPGRVECELFLRSSADPNAIALRFQGAKRSDIDAKGNLVLQAEGGQIRLRRPTFLEEDGTRRELAGSFVLRSHHQVGFQQGRHDPTPPLAVEHPLKSSAAAAR